MALPLVQEQSETTTELRGITKAAALLMALGPEASAKVLQGMKEDEVQALTLRISTLQGLSESDYAAVLQESREALYTMKFVATGGVDYARKILTLAFGEDRATRLIEQVTASNPTAPFEFLRKSVPSQLAGFLQNEHPQAIALILSYLPSEHAAGVLTHLSEELRPEVAYRIASMDRTPPEIVERVEGVIRRRLSSLILQDTREAGGPEHLVAVLTAVDRGTERQILDRLTETDPQLAEEIRKRMFTFDDIILLDDRSIQRVLRDIDTRDLALALKAARDDLKERIFTNMSSRAAEMLREEIAYMGPVRIRNVEEAQQRIVTIVRRLEEEEQIIIARGQERLIA